MSLIDEIRSALEKQNAKYTNDSLIAWRTEMVLKLIAALDLAVRTGYNEYTLAKWERAIADIKKELGVE